MRATAVAVGFALGAFALMAPAAGASIIGPRAGHSPNADDIRTTYWVTLVVAVIVGVIANAALIAAVVRFRARRGGEPARLTAGRGFFLRAGLPLAGLALALFIFGIVMTVKTEEVAGPGPDAFSTADVSAQTAQVGVHGVSSQALSDAVDTLRNTQSPIPSHAPVKGGPLQIDAVAQQWVWRFFYPGGPSGSSPTSGYDQTGGAPGNRTYSVNELVVPVDTPVVLNITSTDVMHRWFVPTLGGQVDAVPGQVSQTWFRADETGVFQGQSTSFSGTGYPAMRTWVRVVSADEYQSYLEKKAKEIGAAQEYVQRVESSGKIPGGAP